jgi:hypothetical protein
MPDKPKHQEIDKLKAHVTTFCHAIATKEHEAAQASKEAIIKTIHALHPDKSKPEVTPTQAETHF